MLSMTACVWFVFLAISESGTRFGMMRPLGVISSFPTYATFVPVCDTMLRGTVGSLTFEKTDEVDYGFYI